MLKDITLGQFFPGNSAVHRLDPRVKIVLTVAFIVLLFLAQGPVSYALIIAFLAVVIGISRISPKMVLRGLKPILFIVIFTAVLNLFYTPGTYIFQWHFLHISVEGVKLAIFMVLRLMLLIIATSMLTYTTSPIQLTDGLERLLSPLKKLHAPVHELSMMMSIALRFIPTLIEETEKIPQPSIDPDNPDEQPEIVLPTLSGFLEEVTLYTDLDNYDENADRVIMMTMHSAKGLEFNNVFFCGAEEGIFPGVQAIYNPDQIEEERRLAYVCITRAKKQLYITNAAQRMIFGQTVRNRVSRFVTEIPASCCDVEDKTVRKASAAELKRANTVKKTHADNAIGVGGLRQKTTSYSSDAPTGAACTLKAGDRVSHKTFGEGSIVKVTPMGGDCLLEVLFDTVGTKKIMYKFAKLTKLS